MKAIDRPFRFTWDFCIVWTLLAVPIFFLTHSRDVGPWYSEAALLILAPLLATFVLYGPILLVRQVIRSRSRGRFVAGVLLSVVLAAALLFVGLLLSGFYTEGRAQILAFFFTGAATVYLCWRLERHEHAVNEAALSDMSFSRTG